MVDGEKAATAYTIGWEPQPGPQTTLLACPVFEVFFGGARGGGKTDGMPPAANQKATSVGSSIGVTPPTEPTKRQKANSCAQFLQS